MGSDVEMIFSSSGANCSILVVMAAPPVHGARGPPCLGQLYQFVDSCRSSRPAPILLSTMAVEINGSVRPPRLLDRVREANRLRHGSRSTEKSYIAWIRRYIVFHGKRHPAEM